MSVHVSSAVWQDSTAQGSSLLVMLALADWADDEGWCHPKIDSIAKRCRVGRRSVSRYLADLVKAGELEVEDRHGDHTSNRYRVLCYEPRGSCQIGVSTHATVGARLMPTVARQEPSLEPSVKKEIPDEAIFDATSPAFLCRLLADRVQENGSKRPTVTKAWLDSCRLLIEKDGRTPEQVRKAIEWCQGDEFWRANVMSMPKLRAKYDQLRLAALRDSKQKTTRPDRPERKYRPIDPELLEVGHG